MIIEKRYFEIKSKLEPKDKLSEQHKNKNSVFIGKAILFDQETKICEVMSMGL